ncbi:unnamed protein product [Schistosoma turkestanicum]|nr:unnamed protein product [Schistosoma turkestanicum]
MTSYRVLYDKAAKGLDFEKCIERAPPNVLDRISLENLYQSIKKLEETKNTLNDEISKYFTQVEIQLEWNKTKSISCLTPTEIQNASDMN